MEITESLVTCTMTFIFSLPWVPAPIFHTHLLKGPQGEAKFAQHKRISTWVVSDVYIKSMGKFYICVLLLAVKMLAVYSCVPSCLPQLTMLPPSKSKVSTAFFFFILKTLDIYSLIILEIRNLKSRCQQDWFLLRGSVCFFEGKNPKDKALKGFSFPSVCVL